MEGEADRGFNKCPQQGYWLQAGDLVNAHQNRYGISLHDTLHLVCIKFAGP